MVNPQVSKKKFEKRLSKLPLLGVVNGLTVGSGKESECKGALLLTLEHHQSQSQIQHFKATGEVSKLLKAISKRFSDLDIIVDSFIPESKQVFMKFIDQWFVFTPDAYALTYEETSQEGKKCFEIYLGTPLLAGLYDGKTGFNDWGEVAAFIDSVLLHELAHCHGEMHHGKKFKSEFKALCGMTEVTPII